MKLKTKLTLSSVLLIVVAIVVCCVLIVSFAWDRAFTDAVNTAVSDMESFRLSFSTAYDQSLTDEAGEEHTVEMDFSLEIVQPVIETEEEETELTEEPAFQWWVVILVGFAIIAVIVAVIVVTKVTRAAKLK